MDLSRSCVSIIYLTLHNEGCKLVNRVKQTGCVGTFRTSDLLLSCCSSCEIWELVVSRSLVRLACSLCTSSTSWAVSLSLALSSASRFEWDATSSDCS